MAGTSGTIHDMCFSDKKEIRQILSTSNAVNLLKEMIVVFFFEREE